MHPHLSSFGEDRPPFFFVFRVLTLPDFLPQRWAMDTHAPGPWMEFGVTNHDRTSG